MVLFIVREHFLREVVFRGPYFVGQSQIDKGAKDRKSRGMSTTQGEARLMAEVYENTGICAIWRWAKRFTTNETGSGAYAYSVCREQNNIIFFFLHNGEIQHILRLPTIIIV